MLASAREPQKVVIVGEEDPAAVPTMLEQGSVRSALKPLIYSGTDVDPPVTEPPGDAGADVLVCHQGDQDLTIAGGC